MVGTLRDLEGRPRRLGRIGLGCVVGAIVARRSGVSVAKLADCAAPAPSSRRGSGASGTGGTRSSSAGRPISRGASRSIPRRPIDYVDRETFHPTFLYEALWCFASAGVLLLIERRFKGRIRPGGLFALYVLIYSIGRLWIETLRIDPSHEIGGVRLNVWVAGFAILASAAFFAWWQRSWKRPGAGSAPPRVETMAVPKGR